MRGSHGGPAPLGVSGSAVTAIVSVAPASVHSILPRRRRCAAMNPVLADMVRRFRSAQDRGVAAVAEVLGPALGVRLPASNREWVSICVDCGLYKVRHVNGIGVYAHGYGIELTLDGLTIDFDWGDLGEPDGFDAWWLWNFVQSNGITVDCGSFSQVRSWLEEAAALGELTRDDLLYYSPANRAGPPTA
jgi:uncharacterized protein DUF6896